MYNPISTYRLQFHKGFTFNDFKKHIPYLQQLGVKTIYASPIFQSTPGSVHGYDGLNPHRIDSEIGTEQQLFEINKLLQAACIGWLQDIVPNHMAFDPANPWLRDVLEKGERSKYASFFDVPWTDRIYHGKIMLPFLGSPLPEVIAKKELKVAFEKERFVIKYYDSAYPLRISSYTDVLTADSTNVPQSIDQLIAQIRELKKEENTAAYREPVHEIQLQIEGLFKDEINKAFLEKQIESVNDNPALIEKIAGEQVYQLCHWQKADSKINFRRFFTINGLICLNMQDAEVFEHYHKYIKKLLDEGVLNGLRVDHVDGLYNPTQYLQHLRRLAGDETYIVVEKILEPNESLPDYWKIEGNTGYDFLAIVNNLFTLKSSKDALFSFYKKLVNDDTSIQQQIHDKKSLILHEYMGGELTNLHNLFVALNLSEEEVLNSIEPEVLREAIAEFLIQCPVYRYYGNRMPLSKNDEAAVQNIIETIKASRPELPVAADLLKDAIISKPQKHVQDYNERALKFYQRCMQFTGPLMAKGVEDTLFYTYNSFIAHNEVGDAPDVFGYGVDTFHSLMIERNKRWRLSMNGTSTHDTKRGEDVRARLNVLSDLADEWIRSHDLWDLQSKDFWEKKDGNGVDSLPDANERYMIYQTIAGAYPMPGEDEDNFPERLQEFIQKALREAKTHSNWAEPNEEYESAAKAYAARLLDKQNNFWKTFEPFHKKLADFGIINSLSQVILKFTCPGVPDLYQGTELWDLSLVDPDNRRLVDFEKREALFAQTESFRNERAKQLEHLWQTRSSGAIKQWLIHKLLKLRTLQAQLFTDGEYVPLSIEGEYKDMALAFARRLGPIVYVVVVSLHIATICEEQNANATTVDWKNTQIVLPGNLSATSENFFTEKEIRHEGTIALKSIFTWLPFAVLKLQ